MESSAALPHAARELLLKGGGCAVNFECAPELCAPLRAELARSGRSVGFVRADEGFYDRMDTAAYLRLFERMAGTRGMADAALAAMGLETAFDPGRADFSALGTAPDGPLYVSSVVHKARIEVNEKGTEAAAATVVEVEDAAAPTDYRELVLDRPFCYAVVDLERGVPLFLGTFERP